MKRQFLALALLLSFSLAVPAKYLGKAEYSLEVSSGGSGLLRLPENTSFQQVGGSFDHDSHGAYKQVQAGSSFVIPVSVDYSSVIIREDPALPLSTLLEYASPTKTIALTPEVNATAELVAGNASTEAETVSRIMSWVMSNVQTEPVPGSPDSHQVLETMKGQCREKTILFIALLRARGIPARYVSGLLYSNDQAFLHAWAEVYFPGSGWIPFDLSQEEAVQLDAGHVKLWHALDPADVPIVPAQEYTLSLVSHEEKQDCYHAILPESMHAERGRIILINVSVVNKCPGVMAVFRAISTSGIKPEASRIVKLLPDHFLSFNLKAAVSTLASNQEQVTVLPGDSTTRLNITGVKSSEGIRVEKVGTHSLENRVLISVEILNSYDKPRNASISFKTPERTISRSVEILPGQTESVQQEFEKSTSPYTVIIMVLDQDNLMHTTQITIPAKTEPEVEYSFMSVYVLIAAGILLALALVLLSPYIIKGKKPFGGDLF